MATRGRTELRSLSSSASRPFALAKSHPPKSKDRGPKSEEDTQTDFGAMNVLGNTPPPTTAVDACMEHGFALDSGLRVIGSGVLLVGGECFRWRPWVREGRKEGTIESGASGDDIKGAPSMSGRLKNSKGQLDISKDAWGILDLVWPKPDLLILGTGEKMIPLAPETRKNINELGIRIEVQDTRNAAAQFNMLATERGTQQIAAALVPVGWKEGK
ncbi:NADH dehydrogenase [ubiquinone] 1 alpha subcomplex assembly factor 3 [Pseudocercospora fuligena]|uniref:NADH dehydrogenase [ubiquinone] 1 alpha subcomplex assembly factor 3 n=1 Tax=Pseudocercospora fuligena TaxID=685502 RepID=A0A8H6RDE9_9PEZI|nr:NADH dehydrogenase [ubiquinone] 1 alpha subcomplex assembly factor 3 [Pseudocercospora fuligena]